jgi:hypothetical protein
MNQLEIGVNKGKMIVLVVLSLLFVVGSVWIYVDYSTTNPPIEPFVLKIIGISGMLFFGFAAIMGIKRIVTLKIGLVIDAEGIHDFMNKNGIDCIRWEDINIIHETAVMTTKMIQIDVKNPQEYLSKATNGIQRGIMKSNVRHHGSPFVIASGTLKMKHSDLLHLLKEELVLQHEQMNSKTKGAMGN